MTACQDDIRGPEGSHIASDHYITAGVVRDVLSAVLAVLLWWLPILGVSLHLH